MWLRNWVFCVEMINVLKGNWCTWMHGFLRNIYLDLNIYFSVMSSWFQFYSEPWQTLGIILKCVHRDTFSFFYSGILWKWESPSTLLFPRTCSVNLCCNCFKATHVVWWIYRFFYAWEMIGLNYVYDMRCSIT